MLTTKNVSVVKFIFIPVVELKVPLLLTVRYGPLTVSPAVTVSICCSVNGSAARAADDIAANKSPESSSFFIAPP